MKRLSSFLRNDSGATAIEYGLIASLLAVVIITAVTLAGENLTGTFNEVASALDSSSETETTTTE